METETAKNNWKSTKEKSRKRRKDGDRETARKARTYSGLTVSPHPVTLLSKPNADT